MQLSPERLRWRGRPRAAGRRRLLLLSALALLLPATSATGAGGTTRVSVDRAGGQADGPSEGAAISGDGRFVAFQSSASDLVDGDTNDALDVFVRDLTAGVTTRVSVDSAGGQADDHSRGAAITADGRFVAFTSFASNLVPGDTNGLPDVFVHDRRTGRTERVSVDSAGRQAAGSSDKPALSGDGRYVAFVSDAADLVAGDTNDVHDVFVHDRQTGSTTRVSIDSAGRQADAGTFEIPAMSADGRLVAFLSPASNLVPGDTNQAPDVFVHDRQTGSTERASVDSAGRQAVGGTDEASPPALSGDGRSVAFASDATNLVGGDTNGEADVFVHDRRSGATTRVSRPSGGGQGNGESETRPAISADGRLAAFASEASNLEPGDVGDGPEIFVHDRQAGTTGRVRANRAPRHGNGGGDDFPAVTADGRLVAFESFASDLVPGDTNDTSDVFVHDRSAPRRPAGSPSVDR